MEAKRTSVFENGMIWFGAAVSIAEIMTGTYFAPLGFTRGLFAILLGHIIGCILLFLAGYIGAKTGESSMESVKASFGHKGALFFALVNIIQLVGWTAIMIYDGAISASVIFDISKWNWCIIIGGLIILWILIGIKNLGKVNSVAMLALFILTIVLSFIVFGEEAMHNIDGSQITFGAAVELSVAMPLSWLPLISDYTREAEKPTSATAVSAITYGVVSSWMYIIGMGAAIFTGESDIAQIMVTSGLGVAGLIIIIFSTVTTTFLDAYSAGVSGEAITERIDSRWLAVVVAIIGTVGAICFQMTDITDFLYFIGSVFAPMIAIQIADFYVLKRNKDGQKFCIKNIIVWLIGFIIYRLLMRVDVVLGSTLLDVVITMIICIVAERVNKGGLK